MLGLGTPNSRVNSPLAARSVRGFGRHHQLGLQNGFRSGGGLEVDFLTNQVSVLKVVSPRTLGLSLPWQGT